MGSLSPEDMVKPHAVCIPYPAQGHINPMLKLAKLLHHKGGFHITFVNTEFNHRRLIKSRGPTSLDGLPGFRFETIPDGLPFSDANATQDVPSLCDSIPKHSLEPFCNLISKLNNDSEQNDIPPVTCIVSDGVMTFTLEAAERFGIPEVLFWTTSACGFLGYTQYRQLVDKGFTPFKDSSCMTNGYLETTIDWIPGMKDIRLRDLPSFIRTTDSEDIMLNYLITETAAIPRASAIILNTFDAFEQDALDALSAMHPRIYSVGPLNLMIDQIEDKSLKSLGSNLWKEETNCIEWLNTQGPNSVVYVNFGSITVMSAHQLTEFAWGLANSEASFLWIIRPDIVAGESAMLPPEFLAATEQRGRLAGWCTQEQVLLHPAIGGFLTHSGWNSTIESVCGGVPVICWPFFAEQQTNCRYSCVEWGTGMEIDNDVKRDEVERLVRELMSAGDKGKKMKAAATEWKRKAQEAAKPGGSSFVNLNNLLDQVLLPNVSDF